MSKHTLSAEVRKVVGRPVKKLRQSGWVPANIFGKDVKSTNVQINEKLLSKLIKDAGESSLIYLQVKDEKEDRPVMISELRHHPVTNGIQHLALRQVNLKEKTTALVPVKLVGDAPAVAEKIGILVQQLNEIELETLPSDMPESVEVDVTVLTAVDQAIYVKDLKLNDKLMVKSDPESIVVKIQPLAAEEPKEAPVVEGEITAEGATAAPVEGEQPSSDQVPVPVVDSA